MKRDTYIDDVNGLRLFEGDKVTYQVRRVSSSYSTWGSMKNKNHGYFQINGKIKWNDCSKEFVVYANDDEYKDLKKAKGSETFEQQVWFEQEPLRSAVNVIKIEG